MYGYLYIIVNGSHTKIGITNDLDKRLASYKTHNPSFQVYKTFEADYKEAKRVETAIKQLFKDELSGQGKEWFSVPPEKLELYVSTLLAKPASEKLTPSMHEVRLTDEAQKLKSQILDALENMEGYSDKANPIKEQLQEVFSNRFKLGILSHKLPGDISVRDGMSVDLNCCQKDSKRAIDGIKNNYVKMPHDDHVRSFYHLVRLSTGHYVAIATAKASLPYPPNFDGYEDEIVNAANEVGWYCTFHHEWSWHQPDGTKLVLFQKKTPVQTILRDWEDSFRKFIIERSKLLSQLPFNDREVLNKVIEDITRDSTFPLTVKSLEDFCDCYLGKFWYYSLEEIDTDKFLQAYKLLFSEWNKSNR